MPPPAQPIIPIDAFPYGTHPGVVLRRWLSRRKISQTHAAIMLDISRHTINVILACNRGISPNAAIALGRLFATGADYWITLQKNYELHRAARRRQGKGLDS